MLTHRGLLAQEYRRQPASSNRKPLALPNRCAGLPKQWSRYSEAAPGSGPLPSSQNCISLMTSFSSSRGVIYVDTVGRGVRRTDTFQLNG